VPHEKCERNLLPLLNGGILVGVIDRPPESAPTPDMTHGANVLVVDDEPMTAMYVEQTLSKRGFVVTKCPDSRSAWLTWEHSGGTFSAVVTDHDMPGGTGLELARRLREVNPELPILLLAGYVDRTTEAAARDLDVTLLTKPVTSHALAKAVRLAIARRHA